MIRGFRSGLWTVFWRSARSGPSGRRRDRLASGSERNMSILIPPSSWPAVIVGLIIGIYWLCVLGLVAKTKREVGRAANFVPPERLGRFIRFVWIPLVVAWIFLPLLTPFMFLSK